MGGRRLAQESCVEMSCEGYGDDLLLFPSSNGRPIRRVSPGEASKTGWMRGSQKGTNLDLLLPLLIRGQSLAVVWVRREVRDGHKARGDDGCHRRFWSAGEIGVKGGGLDAQTKTRPSHRTD